MAKKKPTADTEEKRALEAVGDHLANGKTYGEGFRPTDRDLLMYRDYALGLPWKEIVKKHRVKQEFFYRRMRYVSDYVQSELIDDIRAIRAEQQTLLMWHYRQLAGMWDASCTETKSDKKTGLEVAGKPGSPRRLDNPIGIIKEMRQTLESVDRLLGISVKPQSDGDDDDSDERIAGLPRRVAIMNQMRKLQNALAVEMAIQSPDTHVIDAEIPPDDSGDEPTE